MKKLLVFVLCSLLFACSTRHAPAPVVDVQGQVPLSKRVKNSIKGAEYLVKKGETLYSIAWRADIDIRELAAINNIKSPYRIYPGQKIFLLKKTPKPSKNKRYVKNTNKHSKKVVKKPVATTKKQEYGGVVIAQKKTEKATTNKAAFSQKVSKWVWPAKGKVIAKFSSAEQGNKGIDIAGKRGQAIKAAADGKVVYAGDVLKGYGKLIIIKHNDDYLSAYAHNDDILVKEQQTVRVGQLIAKMGDTNAPRVMLHFEVRFRGKSVNPLKYLPR